MKSAALLFLIAAFICPPQMAAGAGQVPSRECRMCGPSCCCPEACEKRLQEKLVSESPRLSCCAGTASPCRIQSASMDRTLGLEGQGAPVPERSVLGHLRARSPGSLAFRKIDFPEDFFCSYLKTVPTPPPRLSA